MGTTRLLSTLQAQIASLIAQRAGGNEATRIAFLNDEAVFTRFAVPAEMADSIEELETLMELSSMWQPVGRMRRYIEGPIYEELSRIVNSQDWRRALLPFQTAIACLAAKRLAERMDARLLCEVNDGESAGGRLLESHNKCADDLEQVVKLVENTNEDIARAIVLSKNNPPGEPAAALQIERDGEDFQVVYINSAGKKVHQERLQEFVNRAVSPRISGFLETVEHLRERLPCHRAFGRPHFAGYLPCDDVGPETSGRRLWLHCLPHVSRQVAGVPGGNALDYRAVRSMAERSLHSLCGAAGT